MLDHFVRHTITTHLLWNYLIILMPMTHFELET